MKNLDLSMDMSNAATDSRTAKHAHLSSSRRPLADVVSNTYRYETSTLDPHVIQQCSVVSIISPYAFSIQLTRDAIETDQFLNGMNAYYESIDDLHISPEYLRKDLLCVTWDDATSTWYRSQVMEYDLVNDTVNVFFVDLSSWEEHVARSRLRFILTRYSSQPVRLLTCRLASIAPANAADDQWDEAVSKTFQNVVQSCPCDAELLSQAPDQTFYINLFASHSEAYVCVNDFLIHCRMAKPVNDTADEKSIVYRLGEDGQLLHLMIAQYWQAGEMMRGRETSKKRTDDDDDDQSSVSTKVSRQPASFTRVIRIDERNTLIFAKCNGKIMLPWFSLATVLHERDEDKMNELARQFGFRAVIIDPLSHPLLCSQLLKLKLVPSLSSQMSLYSIDCARKMLRTDDRTPSKVFDLLDQARLAEAHDDGMF